MQGHFVQSRPRFGLQCGILDLKFHDFHNFQLWNPRNPENESFEFGWENCSG